MKKFCLFGLFSACTFIVSAQWDMLSQMNEVRSDHFMINVNYDKILVAGGWNGTTNLVNSEIYDVPTDTWTYTANNMVSAHTSGAGVRLNTGKIIITGGYNGTTNVTSCEMFDPSTGLWSSIAPLNHRRSYHTAILLSSGKVLVIGGYDGTNNLRSCELYDPATNTWTYTDSLTTGRSYHTTTILGLNQVLVAGGYNPLAGFQLSSVEIFDSSTETWSVANSMHEPRSLHSASSFYYTGGWKVMVAGGESYTGATPYAYDGLKTAEIYDPYTGNWSYTSDMPTGLCYNKQFTLADGSVVVIAGKEHTDYGSGFTSAPGVTYLYTPSSDNWLPLPMNIDARLNFAVTTIGAANVMVSGGDDNTVERYGHFTGVKEVADETKVLVVYPNPSEGVMTLAMNSNEKINEAVVYDQAGKTVWSKNNINLSLTQLDLDALENGMYTVQVQTTAGVISKKITLIK